jgi:hypothetical protein
MNTNMIDPLQAHLRSGRERERDKPGKPTEPRKDQDDDDYKDDLEESELPGNGGTHDRE